MLLLFLPFCLFEFGTVPTVWHFFFYIYQFITSPFHSRILAMYLPVLNIITLLLLYYGGNMLFLQHLYVTATIYSLLTFCF